MEVENEQDPFASITKLCRPTASQEAMFPNCPFARESENFADTDWDDLSSSPEPTPSDPDGIFMFSPPGSVSSNEQQEENDTVFHTPPEHHLPRYFSAEDPNLDRSFSDHPRPFDRTNESKNARSPLGGLDDRIAPNKTRVPAEVLCWETVPADDTEVVADETEVNGAAHDETEVIILDSTESGGSMNSHGAGNSDDDSVDTIRAGEIDVVAKTVVMLNGGVPKLNGIHGIHRSGDIFEAMEDIMISKSRKPRENSPNVKEDIVELKCDAGHGSEQAIKIHSDGSLKTKGKRIDEIDEFRYVSKCDGPESWKRARRGAGGHGERRHLPVTLEGGGRSVGEQSSREEMESKRGGLLDFLDVLRVVVGDTGGSCEDIDYLLAAKRKGLTFPRPRWWPDVGDDE